jgi:AGCS family alanine or glycine:cation symporter
VILCSGVSVPFGCDEGASLTSRAFAAVYGQWVTIALALFLALFAFATMIGWGLYGARCSQYLFGSKMWVPFVAVQSILVVISACISTDVIWDIAEILNGFMAIPNLIALIGLQPILVMLIKEFYDGKKDIKR